MTHNQEIQAALEYIETNLHEELTLDEISCFVGFSKFHFHRVFQKEVGISLIDYVKKRRLARAAAMLLSTNATILDIALTYRFESQEAFTRSFKSVYQLPPGRYRSALKDLMIGGVNVGKYGKIKGWLITGVAPQKYQMGLDHEIYHMGSKAATICSFEDGIHDGEYGTIMQQISAKSYVGKRMRFSGFVKSEEVEEQAGIWMRLDNAKGETLKFDTMQNRPITGTTGWNYYSCVMDIPETTALINMGVFLQGKGQIWFDNADFQEVDRNTPTTDYSFEEFFSDQLLNPSFEEH